MRKINVLFLACASAVFAGIDVRSFGAACDGQTDDAPALQAALDALSSGGTLGISCMLAVGARGVRLADKTGVIVEGSAPGSGIRSLARTGQRTLGFGPATFLVSNCTDCEIRNLNFDGNGAGVVPLAITRSRKTVIRNNRVWNAGLATGGAISADGNAGNEYSGNVVERSVESGDVGTRGMWLGNATEATLERSPVVTNNIVRHSGHTGIVVHGDNVRIVSNTVENAAGAGIKVVQYASGGGGIVKDNMLRRNRFHGLQLEYCRNLKVSGNVAELNELGGIYALFGLEGSQIQRNTLRNNNRSGRDGPLAGIWLAAAATTSVTRNEIYDSGNLQTRRQANGIVVLGATPGAISNLTIADNTCRNHPLHGIQVIAHAAGAVKGLNVTGNFCTDNGQSGLKIDEKAGGAVQELVDQGNVYVAVPPPRQVGPPGGGRAR
jgi:parallel beta-helix repeat protein